MAVGITPNEINEYVLECDRELPVGDPKRTVFTYRSLTPPERAKIEDAATAFERENDVVQIRFGTANYLALRAGLTGWENYVTQEGEPIPFEKEGKQLNIVGKNIDPPSDKTIGRLTPAHAAEIANAIREAQRLTRTDVKN